ncbi:FixH family protein [Virgibacillus necropolis]|uniref:YtkA-like domain-containing protein n=1 Tax=Virgibacillus necropolis TaxID=163877 RepID=A0A221MAS7_9BACI|nr:FixH family protein [Virgibacillus necropolis]ASN04741.1 hypothetical protein CFK40_06790 [Virgibacillus necropolis]
MMKKLLFLAIIIVLLSACGKSDESAQSTDGDMIAKPIDAGLEVPKKADINEPVTFSVTVTQDGEAVKDANDIEFEVWKNGEKEESEMIKAKHQKDGIYTAEKVFKENGIYSVQSHVTARNMHTMPKSEITIGEVTEDSAMDQKNASESSEDQHHHGNTTVDFQLPEMVTAKEASTYVTVVTHKGTPLENALVRLEVWKDGSEKHNYVNLNESETGTYRSEMVLEEKGSYHITVHVEKEEIHTHKEFKIEVK